MRGFGISIIAGYHPYKTFECCCGHDRQRARVDARCLLFTGAEAEAATSEAFLARGPEACVRAAEIVGGGTSCRYVGSSRGDSQLVRLSSTPVSGAGGPAPSFLEVLENYASLGPIVDFAVVDLERQGQGQVPPTSLIFLFRVLVRAPSGTCPRAASISLQPQHGMWAEASVHVQGLVMDLTLLVCLQLLLASH